MEIGIILASGESTRFKSKIPKQLYKLNNRYLIEYSIKAMKLLSKIIIITNKKCYHKMLKLKYKYKKLEIICNDTKNRNETILKSVEYIKKYNPKIIIIHDSARPYIKMRHIYNLLNFSKKYKYVQYCMKLTNGLGKIINKKVIPCNRDEYIELCSPICINYKYISKTYDVNTIELFEKMDEDNVKYKLLYGSYKYLRKITYINDV